VLWRSLAAATGDIIVSSTRNLLDPRPMFVPKLSARCSPPRGVHLVKGFYRRPLKISGARTPTAGGGSPSWLRATARVAGPESERPDAAAGREYCPAPASCDLAAVAPGYGVEIGLLIDTLRPNSAWTPIAQ